MSVDSDLYEHKVANEVHKYIKYNKLDWSLERPTVDTSFSDIAVTDGTGKRHWIEVKMNITDNLLNKRLSYLEGIGWAYFKRAELIKLDYLEKFIETLNNDRQATKFISDVKKFMISKGYMANGQKLALWSTLGGVNKRIMDKLNAIYGSNFFFPTTDQMKEFIEETGRDDRYIMNIKLSGDELKDLVFGHYQHKSEPVAYIQIGDNFFLFNKKNNPLKFKDVDEIEFSEGIANFRMSTRSKGLEFQPEVKACGLLFKSKYSFKPNSVKKWPYSKLSSVEHTYIDTIEESLNKIDKLLEMFTRKD